VEKKAVQLSPWEQAEEQRGTLEAMAEGDRTRAEYTRAMDAYRAIYHANPADLHAPGAVNAVAELLAEQGRTLHDSKSLEAAVGQYEFLRKQYPTSSLDTQALLAEGQIEENDLSDKTAAREKYQLLLKEHPRSEQAEEAKAGLESLSARSREQAAGNRDQGTAKQTSVANASSNRPTTAKAVATESAASGTQAPAGAQGSPLRGAGSAGVDLAALDAETRPAVVDTASVKRSGNRALVTGIRHWSTSTYTRVAIDLGDNVTYEAARVPNPDRIYFDIHGARLAPELVGKSFTVTDDGFLKKVRAAQYSDDVTRVVLDVNDVTEYSAFLLPNPYRLIIDIHGGKKQGNKELAIGNGQRTAGNGEQGTGNREQGVGASVASNAAADVPAPQTAAVVKATPGRPVPNSVATKTSTTEVADLSDMPGRVDATSKPTSKPISAVVLPGNREQGTGNSHAAVSGRDETASDTVTSADTAQAATVSPAKKTRKGKKAADTTTATVDATPARAASPMADGETSLVRALGLKIGRIVIDAGHGGHDSGTLGADGIEEKDVVLDVALRLGKLLHDRLGAEVVYTRSDDTFIPLETRTAIANKAQADLFISIHANSSSDPSARGVEVYYLNFTSDPTALDVAARENAVSDQSIHQLSDLVKKIALKDKITESREFAADVEQSLYSGLRAGNAGLKDRGVKKAPFVVLIGANMPSILAEISFVTNPKDAEQLEQPEYRERVAESLYRGVARYEGGLSGTHVATERASVGQ
jgi:N-acetylmuramoyl-L-alanine amidase